MSNQQPGNERIQALYILAALQFYFLLFNLLAIINLIALIQAAAIVFLPYLSPYNFLLIVVEAVTSPHQVAHFALIIIPDVLAVAMDCSPATRAESHLAVADSTMAQQYFHLASFQGGFLLSLCAKIMAATI